MRPRVAAISTVTEVLTEDHRALETYYNEIVNNPDDIDHQTRYGNQFTWELARHSVAEELLIYPAMEKYMGEEGKAHAEKDRKQHHKLKELLKEFQNMSATDTAYVPHLKELWSFLGQHIKEEEKDDLPALERALSSSDNKGVSETLAKNFSRTKMLVPSRSHPSAGENPLFEGAMGLLFAPIDHVADIFRKFPDGVISPNPSKK
ncbi:HHE domain-containing protein [Dothidotthia symphoricarpi CBS 119687]|uniref:HHE domain-containing protein n=1 Tax=Dothidotthia symphoricarpi CBS 119687 TaxID=1392245 RepID=A0A6A5ZWE8_9PLEO|nr:HHE domain-containing protein [Dothidotthia symphoricarpi CBS 119687]KAF2123365.1 HHE domain-containing protein [Dothidotthia symphoricarpi CBS 119687]